MDETAKRIWKWADSAIWLAGGTLLLYLVSANYLVGYLSFYSARADWFNPSLFQLVSFAFWPICTALFLGGAFQILQTPKLITGWPWIVFYLLWFLFVILVVAFEIRGDSIYFVNVAGSVERTLYTWALLAALPLISALSSKGIDWWFHKNPPKLDTPGLNGASLQRLMLINQILMLVFFLWNLTTITREMGWAAATVAYAEKSIHFVYAADDTDKRVDLIFTDGTSTLSCETKDGIERLYFRNPSAGNALLLQTPNQLLADAKRKEQIAADRQRLQGKELGGPSSQLSSPASTAPGSLTATASPH